MRSWLLAAACALLATQANAQDLSGFKLTFDDEFNSLNAGTPGTKGQTWETSDFYHNLSTGNYGTVDTAPVGQSGSVLSVQNGVLSMGVTQQQSPYLDTNPNGVAGGFSQEHGYFEARMMMTPGSQFWNAFWLLPNQGGWPPEIDIVEADNNMVSFTNHGGDISTPVNSTNIYNVPDVSSGFHTYGLMWTATTLTWYMDGQVVFSAPTADNENVPMNIILSAYDQGGSLSGMYVDYVRVCSNDGANPEIAAQAGYNGACAALGNSASGTLSPLAPATPAPAVTAPPLDPSRYLYNPARDDPPPPSTPTLPAQTTPATPAPCAADNTHQYAIVVSHACGTPGDVSVPIVWDASSGGQAAIQRDAEPFEAIITGGGG